jgi:hypothetical protein
MIFTAPILPSTSIPSLQQVTDVGASTTNQIAPQSMQIGTGADATIYELDQISFLNSGAQLAISAQTLTAARFVRYKDESGLVALTSDIPAPQTLQQVADAGNTTTTQLIAEDVAFRAQNAANTVWARYDKDRIGVSTDNVHNTTFLWNATTANAIITFRNLTGIVAFTYEIPKLVKGQISLVNGAVTIPGLSTVTAASTIQALYVTLNIGAGLVSVAWRIVSIVANTSMTIEGLTAAGVRNATDNSLISYFIYAA